LDRVERSPESRSRHGDRNKFRSTLCRKRAFRATRQTGTMVNVSENCGKCSISISLTARAVERIYSSSHIRLNLLNKVERSPESRSRHGDRNKFRSTLCRKRAFRATRQTGTMVNVSENCGKCSISISLTARAVERIYSSSHIRLNLLNKVERSQNRAPDTVTEINFGLRFAGNGRFVRHGRPGRWSMYLRTAVNAQSPLA
jgi:hypothetical protein